MPKSKDQIDEIKKVRRKQILNAALELFAEKGFYLTSIDEIAKRSGISKGLIYNYYKSKDDLLMQIIYEVFNLIDKRFFLKSPEELTEEDLTEMINEMIVMLREDMRFFRLYFMLYMQSRNNKEFKDISENYVNKVINYLTPYFERKGVEDTRAYILTFISAVDGLAFHYLFFQYSEIEEMAQILIKKFILI